VPAFKLPPCLADADTIGIIHETDGTQRSGTIAPPPLDRLAAACPDPVDRVLPKIPAPADFTWAEHGKELMRRRKAWHY
jgi:hypothetical protein